MDRVRRAITAAALRTPMASHNASRWRCATSTRPSAVPFWMRSSRPGSKRCWWRSSAWRTSAGRSTGSGSSVSSGHAMTRTWRSANMMRATPRTAWWHARSSSGGMRRWPRYGLLQRTALAPLSAAEIDEVRDLATDLPVLWHADTTTAVDRKRLLRLVIAGVTATVDRQERRVAVEILWSGGATTQLEAHLPPLGHHLRTAADVLILIRDLARVHPDHAIAAQLHARGLRTRQDKPWTYARAPRTRRQYATPTPCPIPTRARAGRADGLVSLRAAAERLPPRPAHAPH